MRAHRPGGEQRVELLHALDLGDHVAGAAAHDLVVDARQELLEPGRVGVAQRRHAERVGGALAVGAARRVLPVDMGVLGTGVGDEQGEAL